MSQRQVVPPSEIDLSPTTAQLLRAAADLANSGFTRKLSPAALGEFLRLYSDWIISHRGMSDSLETWAEQSKILVHCMVGAATLEEAMKLHVRFSTIFWGEHIETTMRNEGNAVALIFRESVESGPEGLIRAMWPVIATLSQLEFLAGVQLRGVSARVTNSRCLPQSTVALLFRGPLKYDAADTALVITADQLSRAVVARAEDIPTFFKNFMETTVATNRRPANLGCAVWTLIHSTKRRDNSAPVDLRGIATRLGCSAATLRRGLRLEGTAFRQIKDNALDDLAKTWLREGNNSIEQIAELLGFSNTYSFRWAFHRQNGLSPIAYRRSKRSR
jgi:AraC-like DNA-binding protein